MPNIEMPHDNTDASFAEFTAGVLSSIGPDTPPRAREILTSLIKHLHAVCLETRLTHSEWMMACDFVNRTGQMSDEKRNEAILVCDVLGVESLVDALAADAPPSQPSSSTNGEKKSTLSAILGPFFRENSPKYKNGAPIILPDWLQSLDAQTISSLETARISGRVLDTSNNPISNTTLEVWLTAPNGLYENQDPSQPDMNLRGTFTTGQDGTYSFIALKPTSYPIPYDGPAGDLLQLMGRSPWRPAHVHLKVEAPGFKGLITQIFDRGDKYVEKDSVFAVKSDLIVDFMPTKGKRDAKEGVKWELEYDIVLEREGEQSGNGTSEATLM
ncbi:Catechol 1,2-dioxygenase [Saitoella coloradoensis]